MVDDGIQVHGCNVQNTCAKCIKGTIIDPYMTCCAAYERKPNEVFYGGEPCPEFLEDTGVEDE